MPELASTTFPVDVAELVEALEELQAWQGRAAELPAHLRQALDELAARRPHELCDIQRRGLETFVGLKPEVRALLANLRVLSPAFP